MHGIRQLFDKDINGLHVNLFEFDIYDEYALRELRGYLISKIRTSRVHDKDQYDLTYYCSKNLKPEFIEKLKDKIFEVNIPKKTKIPQFDVRRERVTEWMAQYFLEQIYGCRFYDETDKRLNIRTLEIDKHTEGIDVTGIKIDGKEIRFVVCEVKASESAIPSPSASSLQEDIQKSINNTDNRLSREILQYMDSIRNSNIESDEFQKIIDFLVRIIANENGLSNIIFFPFLLRNNGEIVKHLDLRDYNSFSLEGVKKRECREHNHVI